jgi:hypothetical protein
VIAGAANQIVHACTFAPQDDDAVAGEIELIVVGGSPLIESNNPKILAFELFKRSHQVDHAGDAQVLRGAGTGLDGDRAEGRRPPLSEDHAVHTRSIRHSQQGAEILRVFNTIESEKQTGCAGIGRGRIRREEILKRQ